MFFRPLFVSTFTALAASLVGAATHVARTDAAGGADAYISSHAEAGANFGGEARLRVRANTSDDRHRKIYLRFPLAGAPFAASAIETARLELTLQESFNFGANFEARLYGLPQGATGDGAAGWAANSITWNNAPANATGSRSDMAAGARLLGSFTLSGSRSAGTRIALDAETLPAATATALRDFLREDSDGYVTLVITAVTRHETSVSFVSSRGDAAARPALVLGEEAPTPVAPLFSTLAPHPRLILTPAVEARIRAIRATDPLLENLIQVVVAEAERGLLEPVIERRLDDPNETRAWLWRMKDQRRAAMYRVLNMALAYRLDGDERFAARAAQELVTAAGFNGWFPEHFLNIGEMTTWVALGYDWLYDYLTPAQRSAIRQGIVNNGLNPGRGNYEVNASWTQSRDNWNQVCNAGLILGALAVAEHHPELAEFIVRRGVESLKRPLPAYLPDGDWYEGPTYWAYGTTYHGFALDGLKTALGHILDTASAEGYAELGRSGAFHVQTIGPTNLYFNFGDSKEVAYFSPVLFWLGRWFEQPVYAWFQRWVAERDLPRMRRTEPPRLMSDDTLDRFLPFLVIWYDDAGRELSDSDLALDQHFRGKSQIGVMRGNWTDPDATYLAFKGGQANDSHAHMDAGSFVLDALGVRWGVKLGKEHYDNTPGYFDASGPRFQYFRLNNRGHNTLTINNALQRSDRRAMITHFSSQPDVGLAVLDLTPVYQGQAQSVRRGFALVDRSRVLVQDRLEGVAPGALVRWAMFTGAEVSVDGRRATLTQDGRRLFAEILEGPGEFEALSADPQEPYSSTNEGFTQLTLRAPAPVDGRVEWVVLFTPDRGSTPAPAPTLRPLSMALADGPLPAGWSVAQPGGAAVAGETGFALGHFRLSSAGAGLAGAQDAGLLVSREWQGDGEWVVRLQSIQAGQSSALAGLAWRGSDAANAAHAFIGVDRNGRPVWRQRVSPGAATTGAEAAATLIPPIWLKLTRASDMVSGYFSGDGNEWTQLGGSFSLSGPLRAGFFSAGAGARVEASFDRVQATPAVPALRQWAEQNFGAGAGASLDWLADPDGDGVPNLAEFAFGGHPLSPGSAAAVSLDFADDSLLVSLPRRVGGLPTAGGDHEADGLRYRLMFSTDLASWTPATHHFREETVLPDAGGLEQAIYSWREDLERPSRLFVRVEVEALHR